MLAFEDNDHYNVIGHSETVCYSRAYECLLADVNKLTLADLMHIAHTAGTVNAH